MLASFAKLSAPLSSIKHLSAASSCQYLPHLQNQKFIFLRKLSKMADKSSKDVNNNSTEPSKEVTTKPANSKLPPRCKNLLHGHLVAN